MKVGLRLNLLHCHRLNNICSFLRTQLFECRLSFLCIQIVRSSGDHSLHGLIGEFATESVLLVEELSLSPIKITSPVEEA